MPSWDGRRWRWSAAWLVLVSLLQLAGLGFTAKTASPHPALYSVVANASSDVSGAELYLVRGGTVRLISSPATLVMLCLPVTLERISISNASFQALFPSPSQHGQAITQATLTPKNPTADEAMRVFVLRESMLQDPLLVQEQWELGRFINPSVLAWRGQLLLASANSWEIHPGVNYNDRIEFHALGARPGEGQSIFPQLLNTTVGKLLPRARPSSGDAAHAKSNASTVKAQEIPPVYFNSTLLNKIEGEGVVGQDPRMVVISPHAALLAFTWRFSKSVRMGAGLIVLSGATDKQNLQHPSLAVLFHTLRPPASILAASGGGDEKNWSPFMYRGEAHFVHSINPLVILKIPRSVLDIAAIVDAAVANASSSSSSSSSSFSAAAPPPLIQVEAQTELALSHERRHTNLTWGHCSFGHLRGGTNAIFLPKQQVYLSLFHSSTMIRSNTMKSYFVGAYTFSAQEPFRLLSVSPRPLLRPEWTLGAWDHLKNRKIDYITFPMGLSLMGGDGEGDAEGEGEGTLLLSFGRQDYQGWLGTLSLSRLLDSLEQV